MDVLARPHLWWATELVLQGMLFVGHLLCSRVLLGERPLRFVDVVADPFQVLDHLHRGS